MRRVALPFLLGLLYAAPAYAHGEEILLSIYAQVAAVVATLLFVWLVPAVRAHWLAGSAGCIAGVVLAWALTGHLPYMQYRAIFTTVGVLAPIGVAAVCVFLARKNAPR
jgi:hypothetical protein